MNQKAKGILLIFGTLILLVILTAIISMISVAVSPDPWIGLGVAIIMVIISVVIMVALLIVGIVKYSKHKSEFGLGLIYGVSTITAFLVGISILTRLFNLII